MAITTENQMRSVQALPFYATHPVISGAVDAGDLRHSTFLFRGLLEVSAPLAPDTPFCRSDAIVVSLTLPGTITGSQQFLFSRKEFVPLTLALADIVRPMLLDYGGRPTRIQNDKALTQRSTVSLRFAEDEAAPDFDSTKFTTFTGNAFWRRLVVAQPDYIGSILEVRRGRLLDGVVSGGFAGMRSIFKGRLEQISFNNDGSVTVEAKDILTINDRLLPPRLSNASVLDAAITAFTFNISVTESNEITDPEGLPSKDFFPVVIRLQPDSVDVLLTAATWTAASRQITEAGKFANYVFRTGDQIFLKQATITDQLFTILARLNDNTIVLGEELAAGDLAAVTSIPFEDVILQKRLLIGDLIVQQNFLLDSNDPSTGSWTKSGVTVGSKVAVGPFGAVRADQLNFAAESDFIEQDSGESTDVGGVDFTSAVWLKRRPNATADETITIDHRLSDDSQITSSQVTLTDDWQRFEVASNLASAVETVKFRITRAAGDAVACLFFGSAMFKVAITREVYAATGTLGAGVSAGRGAFGTTNSAHAVGTPMQEVLVYQQHESTDGVHPIVIIRDLLNRGQIDVADIDQTSFDREFNFIQDFQLRKGGTLAIREPKRISEHIEAVRQQALIDLWVSETGLVKVRLSFRQNIPGQTTKNLTHENNTIFRTLSINNNRESRITRIYVFFDPLVNEPGENPGLFDDGHLDFDPSIEALSGERSRRIFGDWIFRRAEAVAVAGRTIGRFKRAARIVSSRVDLSDEPDFDVGDVVEINSPDILTAGAAGASVRFDSRWQVVHRKHNLGDGQLLFEALEFSGRKYAIISPDLGIEVPASPFPDHDAASDAEKEFGFIGDSNNEVTLASGQKIDGYYIL